MGGRLLPELNNLFSEITVGGMVLKNRIVMPPMLTGFAAEDGLVPDRMLAYYGERARGGAALITVESTNIEVPAGDHYLKQLSIGSDGFSEGLGSLARTIQEGGAKASIQIGHQGRYCAPFITGAEPLSPSHEDPVEYWPESPEMGEADIRRITLEFAAAARRARDAGFDAVELHGAHGYLLCQFLSPLTNRRGDRYGGDAASRATFPLEIIRAVRSEVGEGFPIVLRLSADEFAPGGITLEDTVVTAGMAEDAGVDCLHISGGSHRSKKPLSIAPMAYPRGCLVHLAERVKRAVETPVMAVGRINNAVLADRIVREGRADLTAMGRALIADPELPARAERGELETIRPCIGCNTCFDEAIMRAQPLFCAVNARVGAEEEREIKHAGTPRSVAVLGGGPAGMEAARVAALRGHDVTLYEKRLELGGQLLAASKPPFKEEIANLTRYLKSEMERLEVTVELRNTLDEEDALGSEQDALVVATGALPLIPEIPGTGRKNVLTAGEVLAGNELPPGEVVVVLGGEMIGVEVAAYLAERGRSVSITRRGDKLAKNMGRSMRRAFLNYLRENGAGIHTGVTYREITGEGLLILDKEGREILLPADFIVLAAGLVPDRSAECLVEGADPGFVIGDCSEPRNIRWAMHEGFEAGFEI